MNDTILDWTIMTVGIQIDVNIQKSSLNRLYSDDKNYLQIPVHSPIEYATTFPSLGSQVDSESIKWCYVTSETAIKDYAVLLCHYDTLCH